MNPWIALAYLVVALIAAYALRPTPPKQKPPTLDDFDLPTAEAGRPVPAVFGTVTITGPNCVWYGDLGQETETQDGVKTRRYFLGIHFGLCLGPIDALQRVDVGSKLVWEGTQAASGQIALDEPELFGGRDKEGGIQGTLSVMMGESTQNPNSYLGAIQGTPQPAYRGICGVVYEGGLVSANTTYIKPWAFKVARIFEGWYNDAIWYEETAAIGINWSSGGVLIEQFLRTLPLTNYQWSGTAGLSFSMRSDAYGSALEIQNSTETQYIWREFTGIPATFYSFRFKIEATGANDCGFIGVNSDGDANNWHFTPRRQASADATRRPMIFNGPSTEYEYVYSAALNVDEWYYVEIDRNIAADSMVVRLYDQNDALLSTTNCAFGGTGNVDDLYFSTQTGDASRSLWSIIIISSLGATELRDMNPAHMLYQTITDPVIGMGYATSVINDLSFRYAADTFYAEGMGLSLQWVQQSKIEDFQQEILNHCGAILRMNWDGEFELVPIRGDYTPADLTVYDEGEIVEMKAWERVGYGELIGEISVEYVDQETNTPQNITIQNLAAIQSQEGVVSETLQYPGFSHYAIAARVAQRDLDARTVPLARGTVVMNRTGRDLLPGDVFKLSWAKLGLTEVIVRVLGGDYGTLEDGLVSLDIAEDVFGLPDSTYAAEQTTGWTDVAFPADEDSVQTRITEDSQDRITEDNILRTTDGT